MGRDPEPEGSSSDQQSCLCQACGFTPSDPNGKYHQTDIPSLRKLEQFDQIMTDIGLWNQPKPRRNQVQSAGTIKPEKILVHDTTHYYAYSSFQVMAYNIEKGKVHKKSVAHVTKCCGCENKLLDCPAIIRGSIPMSGGDRGEVLRKDVLGA